MLANRLGDADGQVVAGAKTGGPLVVAGDDVLESSVPGQGLHQIGPIWVKPLRVTEHVGVPVRLPQIQLLGRSSSQGGHLPLQGHAGLLGEQRRDVRHCPVVSHCLVEVPLGVPAEQRHVERVSKLLVDALLRHVTRPEQPGEACAIRDVRELVIDGSDVEQGFVPGLAEQGGDALTKRAACHDVLDIVPLLHHFPRIQHLPLFHPLPEKTHRTIVHIPSGLLRLLLRDARAEHLLEHQLRHLLHDHRLRGRLRGHLGGDGGQAALVHGGHACLVVELPG
mmetsp:Transcript_9534/g.24328  ORF Transcript_9534/g.24328 Transcript_9534/m.24328 type:complete len:280 (-) Transcript_9534:1144-1983(-)